jgi:hypothetical protein
VAAFNFQTYYGVCPGASALTTPSPRSPDLTKSPTVVAIREARQRLTASSLRRLREGLFRLELQLVEDMVTDGIDVPRVTALSHCARALDVVEKLKAGTRER